MWCSMLRLVRRRPAADGKPTRNNIERWEQVHDVHGQGLGLIARPPGDLAFNVAKRHDRVGKPRSLICSPHLVDPYLDHLRQLREENPAVPVIRLLKPQ
jgi:hypothetical protein